MDLVDLAGPTASAAADEIDISAIRVGQRHRKDMGDIGALAANIADVGLLHPVVVTPDTRLVTGERRIRAFEWLGRTRIPARVVDLDEIVRGEFSENAHRKDFLPSEMVAIWRAIEPSERAAAKARMSEGARVGKISTPSGKTRDRIGAALGVSGRTLEKYVEIVEAAEAEPDRFGHLPDEMDRVRNAETVCRKLKRARDEERVMALERAPGRVRTLVVDPPWAYEMAGRASIPYATMSHEEMLALPAAAWVEDDAHLYLWTPNSHLALAVELMARWGFAYKTALVWVKPAIGLGSYFRNSTELVLFGVRGKLRTKPAAAAIPTYFEAPTGEHSEKPEAFFELVRAASYPPFGEAFQRRARPDFQSLFRQKGGNAMSVGAPLVPKPPLTPRRSMSLPRRSAPRRSKTRPPAATAPAARLWACMLSRAARSALLAVADIFGEPRGRYDR
jgi:N6-adenosine-specific RNA methylase IME4/ParB-like chromosome segregation protein Spo0J